MRILAHLHSDYGKETVEIVYWGSLDQAKVELYYIEYDGSYYEWNMINHGFNIYDYEALYGRLTRGLPIGANAYKVQVNRPYGTPRCECGAHRTANTNCHAFWCPLYKKF